MLYPIALTGEPGGAYSKSLSTRGYRNVIRMDADHRLAPPGSSLGSFSPAYSFPVIAFVMM